MRPRQPRKPPDATARESASAGPVLGLAVLAVASAAGLALVGLPRHVQTPLSPPPPPPPPQSFDGPLPDSISRALGATRDPGERWIVVQQLLTAGREDDAIALLEHTVAALPEDAAAHEQLGEVLRASLRAGVAAEGGAVENGAPRRERRRRAVAALNRSAALAPTAQLHATIGNLLAPKGEANSSDDAVGACQHYAAALALDATAHAGTTGAAKRLTHLSHAMLCRRPLDEVCCDWGGAHAQGCAPRAAEGAARGGAIRLAEWVERRVEALFNSRPPARWKVGHIWLQPQKHRVAGHADRPASWLESGLLAGSGLLAAPQRRSAAAPQRRSAAAPQHRSPRTDPPGCARSGGEPQPPRPPCMAVRPPSARAKA